MSGLIFKDFFLCKKFLWFFLVPFLLLPGSVISEAADGASENSIIQTILITEGMVMFFGYMITAGVMKHDERKAWAGFIVSSPQAARGQVASKYYFCIIILLAANFVNYLYNVLVNALTEVDFSGITLCSTMFFFFILMLSVEIPFSVRFGSDSGNKYRSMLMLLFLFAGMVWLLFGDLSILGDPDKLISSIVNLLEGNELPDWLLILSALFPYFSMAMFYISYKLSCKLYTRGIESFEK